MTSPIDESELTALLMASPLYQKMEHIKQVVSRGGFRSGKGVTAGDGYLDERDAGWTTDGELLPLDLNKVNSRTFVIYKFGCFVIDLVAAHCDHSPLTLLLAEKIPPNDQLPKNAYRNSFYFDAVNRILYIREARLDSVGQFITVLVHTLAHIKSGLVNHVVSMSKN
jgi:hypothetical protein